MFVVISYIDKLFLIKCCKKWVFDKFQICQVACGEDFTVFLTLDGGVFTCGSGRYGQLGHGDNKDEMLPRKVYIVSICSIKNR